jgi:hypothetical protein
MPWSHTSPMDQKTQFIADYLRDRLSMTELCELYGGSRKPAYNGIGTILHSGLSVDRPSASPSIACGYEARHYLATSYPIRISAILCFI